MTSAPDEITPRQLRDELIASIRHEIEVRKGPGHNEITVRFQPVLREIRLSFIATPSPMGSPP